MALQIIAENQKMNPDFMAGFFETEESWDPEYAKLLGVDLDRCVYWDQREHGAEKGLDILVSLASSGEFDMLVINSVAGLSPQEERDAEMGKSSMALTARMLSKLFRVITGAAAKNNCTLVFINQTRANIGGYGNMPETTGGKALRFYCSQRVWMRKVKIEASDPITPADGVKINCSVVKNRYAGGKNPYSVCSYYARFGEGIDVIAEMPPLLEKSGILRRAGSWYYYEDASGKPLVVNGTECKFRSKQSLVDELKANDVLREELMIKIEDYINNGKVSSATLTEEEIAEIKKADADNEKLFEA